MHTFTNVDKWLAVVCCLFIYFIHINLFQCISFKKTHTISFNCISTYTKDLIIYRYGRGAASKWEFLLNKHTTRYVDEFLNLHFSYNLLLFVVRFRVC